MNDYLSLVTAARAADASLGLFAAHEHVRATLAGRAAYSEFLASKGISRRRDTSASEPLADAETILASDRAASSAGDAYLQAVAKARATDPSLSATAAHKLTMRDHRGLYAAHLRAKGIVRD